MNISLSKVKDIGVGLVVVGLVCYTLYLGYKMFFPPEQASVDVAAVNTGLLGPKLQQAALILNNPAQKISFKQKDLLFTESVLYKSFVNFPENIPLSEKRGREDPFVPYAP
jgi:hypothetical protein